MSDTEIIMYFIFIPFFIAVLFCILYTSAKQEKKYNRYNKKKKGKK